MPWIKQEDCIGCGACVEKCPQDAIIMEKEKARINMDECIRCGTCHDICPQDAVRHDSERVPIEIEENIKKTKRILESCETKQAKIIFLEKTVKAFKREMKVAGKSAEQAEELKNKISLEK